MRGGGDREGKRGKRREVVSFSLLLTSFIVVGLYYLQK